MKNNGWSATVLFGCANARTQLIVDLAGECLVGEST